MIQLEHVHFNYGKREILHDINLTLEKGRIVGVVGESGSGKTTLSQVILGAQKPTKGQVHRSNQRILSIFQHATQSFNPDMTIGASMSEALKYYDKTQSAEAQQRLEQLMVSLKLPQELLRQRPGQVSGGQLQRLNIIRTLMFQPELLICDEITANLDVIAEQHVIDILTAYHRKTHQSMLVISHDLAFLQQFVDEFVVLKDGRIVDHFECLELFDEQRAAYTKELVAVYEE